MSIQKETTLMLNSDGSIYHLNCMPENIASTVILVGDPDRVGLISRYFSKIEFKTQKREFVLHTGYYQGKRITVLSTGIGAGSIDIVMNELDALVNIDFNTRKIRDELTSLNIIRLGTCGSVADELHIDDIVISKYAFGCDSLPFFYHCEHDILESKLYKTLQKNFPEIYSKALYVSSANERLCDKFNSIGKQGITMTCPGFFAPQDRMMRRTDTHISIFDHATQIRLDNYKFNSCEMETGLIYSLGKFLGHNCISLSVVVANRYHDKVSSNPAIAMNNAIIKLLNQI